MKCVEYLWIFLDIALQVPKTNKIKWISGYLDWHQSRSKGFEEKQKKATLDVCNYVLYCRQMKGSKLEYAMITIYSLSLTYQAQY